MEKAEATAIFGSFAVPREETLVRTTDEGQSGRSGHIFTVDRALEVRENRVTDEKEFAVEDEVKVMLGLGMASETNCS
jgi:hypothetical protein